MKATKPTTALKTMGGGLAMLTAACSAVAQTPVNPPKMKADTPAISRLQPSGSNGADSAGGKKNAASQAGLSKPATTARYTIADLGVLPSSLDDAAPSLDVNGTVAGWHETPDGNIRAALWKQGQTEPTTLDALPGYANAYATDLSKTGDIVGVASDPGDLRFRRAVRWYNGKIEDLGTLGGKYGTATAVNDMGQIVGGATLANGSTQAFLWQNGKIQSLGTLPNGDFSAAQGISRSGQIVGISNAAPNGRNRAFLWQNGTMQDLGTLPGGGLSHARALNDKGQIVGWAETGEAETHPFLWQNGKMQDLGTLGDEPGAAWSVNNAGQIVGASSTGLKRMHGFLYENGQMRDLNSLIAPQSGWTLSFAYRINDAGQIVGKGRKDGQMHGFLLSPTAAESGPNARAANRFAVETQTFRDDQGQPHTLAEFRGQPTLLYFFCGCDRCHRLAIVWGKRQPVPAPKTIVFFLGNAQAVRALAKTTGFDPARTILVPEPPTELLLAYKGQPCPRAVVLDASGKTRYTNTRADDDPLKPTTNVIVSRVLKALPKGDTVKAAP